MKTSQQGIDLLIEREALRMDAYRDSKGIPTIGVGHTGPEVLIGLHWTEEKCREVFASDLERFEKALDEVLTVDIPQHAYDALISWLFNVGVGWARKATLIKFINAGDMEAAEHEFDKWHIPPEITSRRNAEREQFAGRAFVARFDD